MCESHFSTGCSKAMPGKDSAIKNEIDEMVPDSGMHQTWCAWWRHQMETFSALLAICAGNSPVPGVVPTQRPVTRNFDVYFDLRPNQRLSKQSRGWWFETLSCSLWRHHNGASLSTWGSVAIQETTNRAKDLALY